MSSSDPVVPTAERYSHYINPPSTHFNHSQEDIEMGMENGVDTPEMAEPQFAPAALQQLPVRSTMNYDGAMEVEVESELSYDDEDAIAEEDDDDEFEIKSHTKRFTGGQASRSSSQESRRSLKRKAVGTEVDEDIMNNPELYGIRRSGRAHQNNRIVNTDSLSDVSDSDVQPLPRKRQKQDSHQDSNQASRSPRTTNTGSDSDIYGTARRSKSSKKRRHVSSQNGYDSGVAHGEIRFSTRKAARANYNEEASDNFEEEVDENAEGYWPTIEDTTPAIDAVLDHRWRDDITRDTLNPGRDDFEYNVKWQGKAHYHATWERNAMLASCRGIRRLENYFRKKVQEDIYMQNDEGIPPEDKEKWSMDRERDLDALNDYKKVERVIAAADDDEGNATYLVKWKGLYYDSCTWEDASLVSEIAQVQIDRYLDRSSRLPVSNRSESSPKARSPFVTMREQPDYIKHGKLREFQILGLNFLAYNWVKGKNVILADEMGLGKTVQTVAFLDWLKNNRGQQGPFLVVVPLSTMPAWAETFDNWTPDLNYVVFNGNESARKTIKEHELMVNNNPHKVKFNVLLTTYEYILLDSDFLSQIKWQFMAVDEAHRLKNRESQLYAKLLAFHSPSRLLITGTPMQNTLGELSALMDFLMPGVVQIDENMDLFSEEAGKKLAQMTEEIQPYMLRRTKNKVENDIPPKTEKIIRVELSDVQLEYYKNILTRNYAALNAGAKGQKQSLLNVMMELKKASNHPFLFPNAEDRILNGSERREDILKGLVTSSGKMMLLDQLLKKLKKDGHRVLIFSQMVKMLDLLSDYLRLRGYLFQRLDGTIAAGPRRMAIDHFNAPDSEDFCFLLSTRAGGLGINLMTADTVILFDSDWNPQADLQAMARAHRIGQNKPVSVYRLVSKETVEEEVLERARNKLMLEFITIQRGVTDKEAREITDKMTRAGKGTTEPNSSEDISRILKRRGQKMFEQSSNQKKLEELDIDAVLADAEEHATDQPEGMTADGGAEFLKSFEYMDVKVELPEWDEIIPKERLDMIKAEEKDKADQEYLAKVIEQNAPRKRKAADDERELRAAKKQMRDAAAMEVNDESDHRDKLDPCRALTERETRNLIRGFTRYGAIEDRGDEVVQEARLENRDRTVLKKTLDDLVETARRLINEEQERVEAFERNSGKTITKKDRKAVLFDYNKVKRINAETIVERPGDMRMLKEIVDQYPDVKTFRIKEAQKTAAYTCSWDAKDDGMLCVGIVRHGYGAWTQIRDDVDLGLSEKFFLEEHRVEKKEERKIGENVPAKSPGAVHLVRRADYLLSVLKEKISNGTNLAAKRAVDNHHRNNKKSSSRAADSRASGTASPAPSVRRGPRDSDIHRRGDSLERHTNGDHGHRRHESNSNHRKSTSGIRRSPDSTGERQDALMRAVFEPVMTSLENVSLARKDQIADKKKRAGVLRDELFRIGNFIHQRVVKETTRNGQGTAAKLDDDFWEFVLTYWPNRGIKASEVKNMYYRIAATIEPVVATVPAPVAPTISRRSSSKEKEERKKSNGAIPPTE